jgi:hypothetical protein
MHDYAAKIDIFSDIKKGEKNIWCFLFCQFRPQLFQSPCNLLIVHFDVPHESLWTFMSLNSHQFLSLKARQVHIRTE